ncbi:MAG: hypothetical protein COA79_02265 [Planctomycetota bacterium]|nr:MAG: hypothetical protein COA79_02265 [Planctomycetota bacterium]
MNIAILQNIKFSQFNFINTNTQQPSQLSYFQIICFSLLFFLCSEFSSISAKERIYEPNRYGLMISGAHTYRIFEEVGFANVSVFASFDYDKIWLHWAPKNLFWKLELTSGMTFKPYVKNLTSLNMIAQYYFFNNSWTDFKIRPYIEGGIGGIYTDFQILDQGSKISFNPQAGLGTEFSLGPRNYFVSVRYHHVSNANIYPQNRGINSVAVFLGLYF